MNDLTPAQKISEIIRQRKTEKLTCELENHQPVPDELREKNREIILNALETAGWAPFHFPRQVDGLAEPWRAHILWDQEAQKTARFLRDELQVVSKEPKLTAACQALVLVTWLPESMIWQDSTSPVQAEVLGRDEEHLAAASAMIQNFLLTLTAHKLGTYWSSGGKYRSTEVFHHLGIPESERLLDAIFVHYPEMGHTHLERKPGAHREKRSSAWIREIQR